MSTTELIFNSTKFYPVADSDTSLTANGKTYYAVPSKITIKAGTSITFPSTNTDSSNTTNTGILENDTQVDCVGANDDYYFFVGFLSNPYCNFGEEEGSVVGNVLKSNCKNIVWGG